MKLKTEKIIFLLIAYRFKINSDGSSGLKKL